MIKKSFKLENEMGLHSRAAAQFVQLTNKYVSQIDIVKEDSKIDGKSIMGILCLGIAKDESIELQVNGIDEEDAVEAIINLLSSL